MWYPNCYDYPPSVMQDKTDAVRADLASTLVRKVALTGCRAFLPSAGPACFLDPQLEHFNDRATTIFPHWEDVADDFAASSPGVEVIRLAASDRLVVSPPRDGQAARWFPQRAPINPPDSTLAVYRERRRTEWEDYSLLSDEPVSADELTEYFRRLQRRNTRFLGDFRKDIALATSDDRWQVRLGRLAEDFVIETEETIDPSYTLEVPTAILRAIVDGRVGWEEALLSMRLRLRRDPDVFDLTFMSLLRYGHEPAQTRQMVRERENTETIVVAGLRVQRWCPHAGEDLHLAIVSDCVIECPRHHWKWDIDSGRCIDGGDLPLRVERIDRPAGA
jgi:UDP-MurNAc hydroxylase